MILIIGPSFLTTQNDKQCTWFAELHILDTPRIDVSWASVLSIQITGLSALVSGISCVPYTQSSPQLKSRASPPLLRRQRVG
eukprot:m.172393 g.172393  ORF g.172393 m.172393 type:complete len:82 (+) comp14833_c0_seq4:614-859(+)